MKQKIIDIMRRIGQLDIIFSAYETLKTINPRSVIRNAQYYYRMAPGTTPIPPIRLIVAVAGNPDIQSFLEGGKAAIESIIDVLANNRVDVNNFQSILA